MNLTAPSAPAVDTVGSTAPAFVLVLAIWITFRLVTSESTYPSQGLDGHTAEYCPVEILCNAGSLAVRSMTVHLLTIRNKPATCWALAHGHFKLHSQFTPPCSQSSIFQQLHAKHACSACYLGPCIMSFSSCVSLMFAV